MKTPDLFASQAARQKRGAPLADRLRPKNFTEFVGQEHILAPGRLLRRAIESDNLPSMILWGPPGCGKTALAAVIAEQTGANFVPFSAVLGGVKEIRQIMSQAELKRDQYAQKSILFIDEIHRLNKAQQDALLPHVEKGTVTLIGATTENPSFEVNAALLSRSRVFVLHPLEDKHLAQIIDRALGDQRDGLGKKGLSIEPVAKQALIKGAQGDARRTLNALETACAYLEGDKHEAGTTRTISQEIVEEALQQKTLLYDKSGEEHYNVVSAFIKSLRGSDPDAAVYWMTRMLEAGEDPRFILRRMVIFASEDVGNADPNALQVATAAFRAHEFVGLPESALCLSQAACYLACAPKSNAALTAYVRARKDVKNLGALKVPYKLRNATTALMNDLGYGRNYQYPHDFEGNYTPEEYLPDELQGRTYYTPSANGYEKQIDQRLEQLRSLRHQDDKTHQES